MTTEEATWRDRFALICWTSILRQDPYIPGWMEVGDGKVLADFASMCLPNSNVVELGSFMGKSTRWLMLGCVLSRSRLFAVDLFTGELPNEKELPVASGHFRDLYYGDLLPVFQNNMLVAFPGGAGARLTPLRSDSIEQAKKWSYGPIDILFEDGDHSRCRQTIEAWMPHLSDHALILMHDVHAGASYGPDGPINTYMSLLQQGWRHLHGDATTLLRAVSRDPEFWNTRAESIIDRADVHTNRPGGDESSQGGGAPRLDGLGGCAERAGSSSPGDLGGPAPQPLDDPGPQDASRSRDPSGC